MPSSSVSVSAPAGRLVPAAPALAVGLTRAAWLSPDGEIETVPLAAAADRAPGAMPMVCHARAVQRRLGLDPFSVLDLLELYAFVRPARFCLPTPRGLAAALGLAPPPDIEGEATALAEAAACLLAELASGHDPGAKPIARVMRDCGWTWGPAVLVALGDDPREASAPPLGPVRTGALEVWRGLPEAAEHGPPPPPGSAPVDPGAARARLAEMLGADAEPRPSQADYASAVAAAFQPRAAPDEPAVVLAEAGTGVGKTLGYVAPASLWAEANGGAVWISTYTRNLQHQIDAELARLHPDPSVRARKVVIRKGRENYLCLLNLEEAVRQLPSMPRHGVALALMARWVSATRDGDMVGGDFPAWLGDLLGRGRTLGLADRRGECIYSACPHYSRCFIENSVRRARRADIVIANHALVMVQAALGGVDDWHLPTRYVFDEGHHVFDAADNAFAGHLTALETVELRRWLLGAEGRGSRARGLKRRVEELVAGDEAGERLLDDVLQAARILPAEGWTTRIAEGSPRGPAEAFLQLARRQVYARAQATDAPYGLECDLRPPIEGLAEAALALEEALGRLARPMTALAERLADRMEDEAADLETATRLRMEAARRSLTRRSESVIGGWRAMLRAVAGETPPAFVDWLAVERTDGRDLDYGLYRHWLDPTVPFAEAVARPAHGVLVTSATLRDGSGDVEGDWRAAEGRTGAAHLAAPAIRAAVPSPFDYPALTRVYIVGDVRKDDLRQVAAAYRELFLAAGGGALGLFTAIQRLRAVRQGIAPALEAAGLPLYAQHVDAMDLSTLIDIFRAEEDSCLLGTDAVRDGVDVPGRSLRLIVFDRVPWPRPDILHRARKQAFGGAAYVDMLTRLRLKQAFGRLVRRADDKGVFVLLDPMMPSRLLGAFPDGVPVARCGLAEAVAGAREFLRPDS